MNHRLLLLALCLGAALAASASPALPLTGIGPQTLVSNGGSYKYALNYEPAVAYDTARKRYLVIWAGDVPASGESEIFGRLLNVNGETVSDIFRISDYDRIETGPPHAGDYEGRVAYDAATGQFLVEWEHRGSGGETSLRAKWVSAEGVPIGADVEPDSLSPGSRARFYRGLEALLSTEQGPEVSPTTGEKITTGHDGGEYVGGFTSDRSDPFPVWYMGGARFLFHPTRPEVFAVYRQKNLDDRGIEIYAQRIRVAKPLSLNAAQIQTNQRIGQAAVRRANAIQSWLDDGVVSGDFRTETITPDKFGSDVSWVDNGKNRSGCCCCDPDDARPVKVPAGSRGTATLRVTARQLRINQRIYSAALRRANALTARIEGQLTGGDIRDGELTQETVAEWVVLGAQNPTAEPTAASVTQVKSPRSNGATFQPTLNQLQTNQRIAQAAVRRTNELRAKLAFGLQAENFLDNSISAVDFAP